MTTLILFVAVLSLLVFVHELGHFLVAKWSGMKVEEFGFGFPPKIWGYKKGGTEYTINWIPLGGFVRIKGESGQHADEPDSFAAKPAWKRLLVLLAGVTMNVVLAGVLLSIGFMTGLPGIIDESAASGAHVREAQVRFLTVLDGGPAARAGVEVGDVLVSIDGQAFEGAEAARSYIVEHSPDGVAISAEREDGEPYEALLVAEPVEGLEQDGVGVGLATTGLVSYSPPRAILEGFGDAVKLTIAVARAFWDLTVTAVTQQRLAVELSGPVGIAVLTGEAASLGLAYLIQFGAVLSVNLAILNVLPLPALDGGRVLFLVIEKIRRKRVDAKLEATVHAAGFAALMMLVVLVTYRDFVRYGGQIWGAITGIFG